MWPTEAMFDSEDLGRLVRTKGASSDGSMKTRISDRTCARFLLRPGSASRSKGAGREMHEAQCWKGVFLEETGIVLQPVALKPSDYVEFGLPNSNVIGAHKEY